MYNRTNNKTNNNNDTMDRIPAMPDQVLRQAQAVPAQVERSTRRSALRHGLEELALGSRHGQVGRVMLE